MAAAWDASNVRSGLLYKQPSVATRENSRLRYGHTPAVRTLALPRKRPWELRVEADGSRLETWPLERL